MQHSVWNMYSRIRNGLLARKKSIIHPKNQLCLQLLKVFYKEGFINGFRLVPTDKNQIEIFLKYHGDKPAINKLVPLSKPGRRLYTPLKTLWKVKTSMTNLIISTSNGVYSEKDCRKRGVGGEILCLIS